MMCDYKLHLTIRDPTGLPVGAVRISGTIYISLLLRNDTISVINIIRTETYKNQLIENMHDYEWRLSNTEICHNKDI